MEELIHKFSIERIHKGGAKFDFEKAKWFNHEWIKKLPVGNYYSIVKDLFQEKGIQIESTYLLKIMELIKDRCTLLADFYEQGVFFFESPKAFDEASVKPKWDETKKQYFDLLADQLTNLSTWDTGNIETTFKSLATEKNIKVGELQMIFRIMLVGSKTGPAVFVIAETIDKAETLNRIRSASAIFG